MRNSAGEYADNDWIDASDVARRPAKDATFVIRWNDITAAWGRVREETIDLRSRSVNWACATHWRPLRPGESP
jgi:hypothetical protein